jgi:hypothetical protein
MRIKSVTVEIRRSEWGILRAYVVQQNAEGTIRGRNLMGQKQLSDADHAKEFIKVKLEGRVNNIDWDIQA